MGCPRWSRVYLNWELAEWLCTAPSPWSWRCQNLKPSRIGDVFFTGGRMSHLTVIGVQCGASRWLSWFITRNTRDNGLVVNIHTYTYTFTYTYTSTYTYAYAYAYTYVYVYIYIYNYINLVIKTNLYQRAPLCRYSRVNPREHCQTSEGSFGMRWVWLRPAFQTPCHSKACYNML